MGDVSATKAVVLVIGDQPILRMQAVDLVESIGCEVIEAGGADEAVRLLEGRSDVRLVFADIDLMGGQDGLKLTRAIRERWPPVELILVSDKVHPAPELLPARGLFFQKPYRTPVVTDAIRRLVA